MAMKRYQLILILLSVLVAGCDKHLVFVEDGQALDLQRKHRLKQNDAYLTYRQAGSKIPLFAGKMIGSGSWQIRAEMNFVPVKKGAQKPTRAAIVFDHHSIVLDGEGHQILAAGKLTGSHNLGHMQDWLAYGEDFILELEYRAGTLSIHINNKLLAELDIQADEISPSVKFGFAPNGAVLNIKEFKASAGKFQDIEPLTFTIPQIDLNDRFDLQHIVARDTTEYYGHPSSVLLDDGITMTMMYLNGHAYGEPRWQRSYDGGLSWSGHLPLPEQWFEVPETDDPAIRRKTPFSEVPTLYRFPEIEGEDRVCMYTGRYPSRYALSEDGGATWSELQPLLFGGEQIDHAVVLFSDMIPLRNGSYMGTFHKRIGEELVVFKSLTSDGLSFSKPEPIASHEEASLCEAEFIRSPDGKRIALLMRENSRQYQSFISFSEDEGMSWSAPVEVPPSLTGDRHKAIYTPDGRLIVSFRDRGHDSPTFGSWVAWVGRFEDLEQGKEGQYRILLKKNHKGNDCAYPTVHLLPDRSVFLATYGQWEPGDPNYILSFHLKMEELDRLYEEMINHK